MRVRNRHFISFVLPAVPMFLFVIIPDCSIEGIMITYLIIFFLLIKLEFAKRRYVNGCKNISCREKKENYNYFSFSLNGFDLILIYLRL